MRRLLQISFSGVLILLTIANFTLAQVNFGTGKISMEVTNGGRVRVYAPVYDSLQQVNRLSILVAADDKHVYSYNEDADYVDTAVTISNPEFSDYEIYSSNTNSYSNLPPAVLCKINIYGWKDEAFGIVKFNIKNQDSVYKDFNAQIGCEFIPKVDDGWGYESMKYLSDKDIISIYKTPTSTYTGFKVLSSTLNTAKFFDWFDGYDAGTSGDSLFYAIMSSGAKQSTTYEAGADGGVGLFSAPAEELKFDSSKDFFVAAAVGATEAEMVVNMDKAVAKYASVFTSSSKPIAMELTNAGRIRVYQDTVQQINRISILVGADKEHVYSYNEDADYVDTLQIITNPKLSDYEYYSSNTNSYSNLPPKVLCKTNIYGWNNASYSIIKFTVTNQDETLNDFNAYFGCEFIPKVDDGWGYESIKLLTDKDIISVYKTPASTYTGIKVLSGQLFSAKFMDWFDGYDAGTSGDSLFFAELSSGTKQQNIYEAGGDGGVGVFGLAPTELKLNMSKEFYLAVAVGADENEMTKNIAKAVNKYSSITAVEKENSSVPVEYSLKQNYPNPFNPSTKISFSLPSRQNVVLKVYNSLGQEISTLVNSEYEAGNYTYSFNGEKLSSGVYFYTLQAGNFTSSKKMLLVK